MRLRAPSLGFVYLCLAVTAFVAFFVWVRRPMWWDLDDARASDLAEAQYLERIADGASPDQRAKWLGEALGLAARQGDRAMVHNFVALMQKDGFALPGRVATPLITDKAWLLGANADRWSVGAHGVLLLVANTGSSELRLEMQIGTKRKGKALLQEDGLAAVAFEVDPSKPAMVVCSAKPGMTTLFEVRADEGNFDRPDATGPGIQVVKVEVVQ